MGGGSWTCWFLSLSLGERLCQFPVGLISWSLMWLTNVKWYTSFQNFICSRLHLLPTSVIGRLVYAGVLHMGHVFRLLRETFPDKNELIFHSRKILDGFSRVKVWPQLWSPGTHNCTLISSHPRILDHMMLLSVLLQASPTHWMSVQQLVLQPYFLWYRWEEHWLQGFHLLLTITRGLIILQALSSSKMNAEVLLLTLEY